MASEAGSTSLATRTRDFTLEVNDELKKVTWPERGELISHTKAMLVFCIVVGVLIFLIDQVADKIIGFIIGLFS